MLKRKSHIELTEVYFWTATIRQWRHLLRTDIYKEVVVDSLRYLSTAGKIEVYAFVILPNHIHLIWRINDRNGKESSQGSFLKFTAHQFLELLRKEGPEKLAAYAVDASNKKHEFWQRDSLAIPLFTRKVALQKLNYIHYNPLAERWQLATDPCEYKYSSAPYYEMDKRNFDFLKDLWEVI